jgi:RNA polymerase sigma factor (sigma-70 family)
MGQLPRVRRPALPAPPDSQGSELARLVVAARRGDLDAFGTIVERFQGLAYGAAYAVLGDFHLAQDAAQEAFVEAYFALPRLRDPQAFSGWFRRIVFKHGDRLRRGKRVRTLPIEDAAGLTSDVSDPETAALRQETSAAVRAGLESLPDHERRLVAWFYLLGHSQREIAAWLQVPESTVKKRLHDARRRLRRRLPAATRPERASPSRTSQMARRQTLSETVRLFIALQTRNLERLQALLRAHPRLVAARLARADRDELAAMPGQPVPQVGETALHWAAGSAVPALVELLLDHGADAGAPSQQGMTALHLAALGGDLASATALLAHGAPTEAVTRSGLTPLHHAAMHGHLHVAERLLAAGAAPDCRDAYGHTPLWWATRNGHHHLAIRLRRHGGERFAALREAPASASGAVAAGTRPEATRRAAESRAELRRTGHAADRFLGRILDARGAPRDGQGRPEGRVLLPVPIERLLPEPAERRPPASSLETGIKVVDLLAPLPRGGILGIFGPPGTGKLVVLGEMVHNLVRHHGCLAVWVAGEDRLSTVDDWRRTLREWGVDGHSSTILGRPHQAARARRRLVPAGLALAEQLRAPGRDVLLLVECELATGDDLHLLQRRIGATGSGTLTLILFSKDGDDCTAALAAELHLDTWLVLDRELFEQRHYPAISPLRSASRLLDPAMPAAAGDEHRRVAGAVRRALAADPQHSPAAPRIRQALRQWFFVVEPWTGIPGEYSPLSDTIAHFSSLTPNPPLPPGEG